MTETSQRWRSLLIGLGLMAVVAAVYWPVVGHDFTNFDDRVYITDNPHVRMGLTGESVLWAFKTWQAEFWHPVTWLSHIVDCQFYGLRSAGHHLTSLLLHLANTILLFVVLRRTTGALWRSAIVAGFFALHPLHVESVAWVADRKDVLSAFFWMLALWAYSRYAELQVPESPVRAGAGRWYSLSLVFFALGLMSKPMLVTLPFVLLLLDFWPLRRFELERWNLTLKRFLALAWEKWPFFGLAIVMSVVAFAAQKAGSVLLSLEQISLGNRVCNALISYMRYLGKTIWPAHLAVYYPHPWAWPWWQAVGAALVLAGVSVLVIRVVRQRPYLAMGWFWYLGTMVPVIGLVQIGSHAMADRYTYIPLIGIFILAVWGAVELLASRTYGKRALGLLGGGLLISCTVCTWFQLKHWQNDNTLFRHALAVTANNYVAHEYLGAALFQQGKVPEAIRHLEEALRLNPGFADAHNNLGVALLQQGRVAEAIDHYEQALRIKPTLVRARANLGMALGRQGRVTESIGHLEHAVRLRPDDADAQMNLGVALFQQGRVPEAAEHLEQALRLRPQDAYLHYSLGRALLRMERVPEAIGHLDETLRLDPDHADARMNLGIALFQQGKVAQGIAQLEAALRLKPNGVEALMNLGIALFQQGNLPEGVRHLERALQLTPDDVEVRRNLELALCRVGEKAASLGNWNEAIRQYQRVIEMNPDSARAHDALGVALAQVGRFAEASRMAQRAIDLAQAAEQAEQAKAFQERLKLHQAERPYPGGPALKP